MKNKKIIFRATALELSLLPSLVAVLTIDCRDSRVNLLSSTVLDELAKALEILEIPGFCKGLVIISGKDSCFVAGADIKEIQAAQADGVGEEDIFEACQRGKRLLARLTALPLPTVAAIHGRCLGGGTELALACKYRLASKDRSTVIGLPEVALGVLPGWGGTVKAAKRFGLVSGLSLVLNPLRPWSAKKALRKGLVDAVVERSALAEQAVALALSGCECRTACPSPECGAGWCGRPGKTCLRELSACSGSTVNWLRRAVLALLGGVLNLTVSRKYPAPQALLGVFAAAFSLPENEALELESRTFARLCKTDASRRCVQKFLELQQAKKAKTAAH